MDTEDIMMGRYGHGGYMMAKYKHGGYTYA